MREPLTMDNAAEMGRRAAEWAGSPEGQVKVRESLERAKRLHEQFAKASRVSPRWRWMLFR